MLILKLELFFLLSLVSGPSNGYYVINGGQPINEGLPSASFISTNPMKPQTNPSWKKMTSTSSSQSPIVYNTGNGVHTGGQQTYQSSYVASHQTPQTSNILVNKYVPGFPIDLTRIQWTNNYREIPSNNGISAYDILDFTSSYNIDTPAKIELLKELNKKRSDVDSIFMNVLRWNESLAGQAWMDVKDCVYKNRRNGAVQAMIHEKKTGNSMFSEAISRWSDEKNFFDPYMPCNVRNSCRYSQLVWATSREVGCARKKCNDMSFITCMYYPVGNTAGYTAYVEGTRCEGCKNSCNSDKLCEWPPNSQPQQGNAFGTPPMGQNRFGNQPMMQQPFF